MDNEQPSIARKMLISMNLANEKEQAGPGHETTIADIAVRELTPREYYRLPWSLTDNGISWLEVTDACNLTCEGCYRPHQDNHKSLEKIAEELKVFKQHRKSDCMSLAGGDPLVHPEIVEIVRMVREGGWKPVINTNGLALGPRLLAKLKQAGAAGFTFHIDTTQTRTDSKSDTEKGHNELRTKFARMVAAEGGMLCSFNQTVGIDTLEQVKDTVLWAQKHPDIVHTVVFILFRSPSLGGDFDYYANGDKVSIESNYDDSAWGGNSLLHAKDIVAKIREVDPAFAPSAYLSGTVDPDTTKWLIAARIANKLRGFGYVGPKFMEYVQHVHHLFRGTWLSYSTPKLTASGRSTTAIFSLLDPSVRAIGKRYLRSLWGDLKSIRNALHLQTFTIIQPADMMADGRVNMCDGCPDMTVHEGQLYWSCRLEEIKRYGCFVHAVPRRNKQQSQATVS